MQVSYQQYEICANLRHPRSKKLLSPSYNRKS